MSYLQTEEAAIEEVLKITLERLGELREIQGAPVEGPVLAAHRAISREPTEISRPQKEPGVTGRTLAVKTVFYRNNNGTPFDTFSF